MQIFKYFLRYMNTKKALLTVSANRYHYSA